MLKTILIILVVVGVMVGGLFTLRNSGRAGMPNDEVLKRASKRARDLASAEKESDDAEH